MVGGSRRLRWVGQEWEALADKAGHAPFNPLDRLNLGGSLQTALLTKPLTPLGSVPPFWGSGIYAIYFRGPEEHRPYGRLANSPTPIYVGRAVARGARKGTVEEEDDRRSKTLWSRLADHAKSVDQALDLSLDDFQCRWLVADMLFVPMAEIMLIQTYRPLWNVIIDGFGNHAPGKGRKEQVRSPWDTLHRGRPWADKLPDSPFTAATLHASVEKHLNEWPPEKAPTIPSVTAAPIDTGLVEAYDDPEDDGPESLFGQLS